MLRENYIPYNRKVYSDICLIFFDWRGVEMGEIMELDKSSKIVIAMNVALAVGNIIAAVAYGRKAFEGINILKAK